MKLLKIALIVVAALILAPILLFQVFDLIHVHPEGGNPDCRNRGIARRSRLREPHEEPRLGLGRRRREIPCSS